MVQLLSEDTECIRLGEPVILWSLCDVVTMVILCIANHTSPELFFGPGIVRSGGAFGIPWELMVPDQDLSGLVFCQCCRLLPSVVALDGS